MSKKNVEDMTNFELSRWYSLMTAVNLIADECEDRGKTIDDIRLEPIALKKYVEGECDKFCRKLEEEILDEKRDFDLRSLFPDFEEERFKPCSL